MRLGWYQHCHTTGGTAHVAAPCAAASRTGAPGVWPRAWPAAAAAEAEAAMPAGCGVVPLRAPARLDAGAARKRRHGSHAAYLVGVRDTVGVRVGVRVRVRVGVWGKG